MSFLILKNAPEIIGFSPRKTLSHMNVRSSDCLAGSMNQLNRNRMNRKAKIKPLIIPCRSSKSQR